MYYSAFYPINQAFFRLKITLPKEIKPYIDPVSDNNVILAATESLMLNGRPSSPKYTRNKNVLIIGGSGSGKTRFWLKLNLMQMHSSYVCTDPKGLYCQGRFSHRTTTGSLTLAAQAVGHHNTAKSRERTHYG
jgi:hypothetical protein